MQTLLRAESVYFFRSGRLILEDVSFALEAGEILHIRGANGVGKTTLLKLLAGLLEADRGVVWRGCLPLYIGHENALTLDLSVWENLLFWCRLGGDKFSSWSLREMALGLLSEDILLRRVRFCSAGDRRKLSLLRLWLGRSDLWLLDEALSGLDLVARGIVEAMLCEHCVKNGGAIVMSEHARVGFENCVVRVYDLGAN